MITFPMPKKLNGEQLLEQLNANGIEVNGNPEDWQDGFLRLNISDEFTEKAKIIIANHVPKDENLIEAEKIKAKSILLEKLGITADEAKLLFS